MLYGYSHAQKIAEYDQQLLYKYKKAKIEWEEIKSRPHDMVILAKDNRYLRNPISGSWNLSQEPRRSTPCGTATWSERTCGRRWSHIISNS